MGATADRVKGAINDAIGKAKQGFGQPSAPTACRAKAPFKNL